MALENITEKELNDLQMFILDVMRHDDAENIKSIVNMLNDYETIGWRDHWNHDFTLNEVVSGLKLLLSKQWIILLKYDSLKDMLIDDPDGVLKNNAEQWFSLSKEGKHILNSWDPQKL